MTNFFTLGSDTLLEYLQDLSTRYRSFKQKNLKLDMSRGKPCPEQLELSSGLLNCLNGNYKAEDGTDCRNYGGVEGLPEARRLFADESEQPWGREPIKFLCPSPGYDRHFAICEFFKIQMIPIKIQQDGPDMDQVEKLVATDETIKGIWCIPKYSNPTGITYSDQVVERLARMKTKASDFRIFWDNAYAVHHLTEQPDHLKDILQACKEAGNPDRVYIFGSTSKISFAGSGIAMVAASEKNINKLKKQLSIQTIGPNKINQLQHVRFFKNYNTIKLHMKKHAAIIKPKFDLVIDILQSELGDKKIASWSKPNGGYFISLNTLEGCAKKVVSMAAEAGIIFTKAGATFPYGKDPLDQNIRIAPTFPPHNELQTAMEILTICIQIVSIKKILKERGETYPE